MVLLTYIYINELLLIVIFKPYLILINDQEQLITYLNDPLCPNYFL